MTPFHTQLTACALAATALLSACGGGGTTADNTPPTVAITDNISGGATGDVTFTFTFTFNEPVTGFTADDITVTNGTKGAFTMAGNGLSATLVVTPPSTGSGNIDIAVAAGKFTDAANNANTAAASSSRTFGSAAATTFLSFNEEPAKFSAMGAYGGALPDVVTAPTGGNGKALKIAKPAGAGNELWGGTFFTVPRVPFTATQKAITARVYSSVANAVVNLKVEVPGGTTTEVAGTTVTQANTWTTVTWDFSAANVAANYTVLAISPDIKRALDGAVYYIDEIKVIDTPVATTNPTPNANGLTLVSFDESTPAVLDAFGDTSFTASTDGTNKVARFTKPTTAQVWGGATFKSCPTGTVGLTPSIPFTASNQTIAVRVKAPRTGVKFSLEARGEGTNGATEVFAEATNASTDWETLTFNFANKTYGTAIDPSKVYNKLSIFPNYSKGGEVGGTTQAAETADRVYLIDDVTLVGSTATLGACPALPVSAAPTIAPTAPTATASNVISIYSNGYTPTTGVNLNPGWGQSTQVADETIAGNAVQKYSNFNYQGIDFEANPINVSVAAGFTHLHVDLWSPDVTSVDVFIISTSGGTALEQAVNVPLTASAWKSIDIPLSSYTTPNRTAINQLKFVATPSGKTVYLDNIYFKK